MNDTIKKHCKIRLRYKNRKKHYNTMKNLYRKYKSGTLTYISVASNHYKINFNGKTPKEHIIIRGLRKIEKPVMSITNRLNIKKQESKKVRKERIKKEEIIQPVVEIKQEVKQEIKQEQVEKNIIVEEFSDEEFEKKVRRELFEKYLKQKNNEKKIKKPINYKKAFINIKGNVVHNVNTFKNFVKKTFDKIINIDNFNKVENNISKTKKVKFSFKKKLPKLFNTKLGVIIPIIILLSVSGFAWYYKEYISVGTFLGMGNIDCLVNEYDKNGALIGEITDVATVVYENNIGNMTRNSKFIELTNVGTLDLEYDITFELDANIANSGVLYYRLYEVTDEVKATMAASGSTKLETYASNNPLSENVEFDTAIPVSNMSIIGNTIVNGVLDVDTPDNVKYYRLDYGMYSTINSAIYSGNVVSVHTKVYISQVGSSLVGLAEGEIWQVENEQQFRSAIANALSGDTIQLVNDVIVDGSVDITKRLHLDTNGFNLDVTGDLLYDFIEVGDLNINVVGSGRINVGNDFRIDTAKSKIHITGSNTAYDIFVNGDIILNGLQNEEEDGILLDNVRIVNNKVGNVPANIYIMSNTRLTVGPGVDLGNVIAVPGSTNIEILNNGTIVQIILSDMSLLDTFAKAQIYIYNLNTILGVVGGTGIVLPETSTPYLGPNNGNTLIVKGASSTDVTVSGSTNFTQEDVEYVTVSEDVIPIVGEENAYIVYIRNVDTVVEDLLVEYFTLLESENIAASIAEIEKLVFYTVNAQYFENEDFAFLASTALPNLHYLDLANARVIDDTIINRIPNDAMIDKISLKTLILPKTVVEIGEYAFSGAPVGRIPSSQLERFSFVSIPSTVTLIESGAFSSARYVSFEGLVPPTLESLAFAEGTNGSIFFVPEVVIDDYRNIDNIDSTNIHVTSQLSDNRLYFVYEMTEALGISLYVSNLNIGDDLIVPNYLALTNRQYTVNEIGVGAFRHVLTPNTGTAITIPTTVSTIKDYAFYDRNILSINLENVLEIGDYAFYKTKMTRLEANLVTSIGDYAFYNSTLQYATLENVLSIGAYAFNSNLTLFEINLGKVKVLDDYALYNCPLLGRVYFKNIDTRIDYNMEVVDLEIGVNAVFEDWGNYLDGRLRVYVPDGNAASGRSYLGLYKNLFAANQEYVYVTGDIIGSYYHGGEQMHYDWGEYSVREITINDVTGYEIIEYHGRDLPSGYEIPTQVQMSYGLTVGEPVANGWVSGTNYVCEYTYTITNNTDSVIPAWTVKIQLPVTGTRTGGWGARFTPGTEPGSIVTVTQPQYGGDLLIGGSVSFTITVTANIGDDAPTVTSVYASEDESIPVISIGEGAYRHTLTVGSVDLIPNNIVYIGDYGLYGLNIHSITANNLTYIGNYALGNTGLTKAEFPALEYLGDYALSNMNTLYSLNLGNVMQIGLYAVSDNPNLEQLFINTTDIANMTVSENAFGNLGTNVNNRMRIYVPDGDTYINYYKNLLGYEDYIYAMGTIVGSFINLPINYDIGEYAVRTVSMLNRVGATVTGLEIIEYHGEDLDSSYQIPTALTLVEGGVEIPVISIGKNAFIHTSVQPNNQLELENNVLLEIGDNAFKNLNGIKTFTSNSLITLGQYAFNASTLEQIDIQNIKTIKSYALSDSPTLYIANLGIVSSMQQNALYNLDNLSQVFFRPSDDTLIFDQNSINDVGGLTNDRIRFYVDTGVYYEENVTQTNVNLSVVSGTITDSPEGNGVNLKHHYTIPITITNNSDLDVSNWSFEMNLGSNGSFDIAMNATAEVINRTVKLSNMTSNGTILAGQSVNITVYVSTTNRNAYTPSYSNASGTNINTTYIAHTNDMISTYKSLFSAEYRDYFYLKGEIVGSYIQANIPYDVGLYSVRKVVYEKFNGTTIYGWEVIEYHGPDLNNGYILDESLEFGDSGLLPLIGIGAYSYRWTNMNGANTIELNHNNLIYIDDSGFRDLEGIRGVNTPNLEKIGSYGLYNNKIAIANLPSLYEIKEYGLANNALLNYMDLGPVEKIGSYAFNNDIGLEQVYFRSTNIDSLSAKTNIVKDNTIFINAGTTIGNRLRIYVPDGQVGNVTYVSAYKSSFAEIAQYIYPTGIIMGNYTYTTLPYDIGEYSIREVTYTKHDNTSVTGWEIVEYHGADLDSTHMIPTVLTAGDSVDIPVIGIAPYAYRWAVMLETNTINLENNNLLYIGDYAFSGLNGLAIVNTPNVEKIGQYALSNNKLTRVTLSGLYELGQYALADNALLNYMDLGLVESIGDYAFRNAIGLEQIYFRSTNIDGTAGKTNIVENATIFDNAAITIGDRLRIYVPDGQVGNVTYATAYKGSFEEFEEYIYPMGTIIGSYTYSTLPYDIGVYSVREVTRQNVSETNVIGYEVVEYHGPDITNDFSIPASINGVPIISIGDYAYVHANVISGNIWQLQFDNNIIYIGNYAFYMTNVSSINGNNLSYIGKHSFEQCNSLTSVVFSGVKYVDDYAFNNNPLMTSVTLGNYVQYIGEKALYYVYDETTRSLYLDVDTPPLTGNNPFPDRNGPNQVGNWLTGYKNYYLYSFYIYVPSTAEDDYESTEPYSNYNEPTVTYWSVVYGSGDHIMPYTGSGNYVYNILGNNSLEILLYRGNTSYALTIPETISVNNVSYNVTALGPEMFSSTTNTTTITIPRYVNTVSNDFLNGNTSITNINVNDNNPYFNDNVGNVSGVLFNYDGSMLIKYPPGKTATYYNVPDTTRVIASNAFSGNTYLSRIQFDANIAVISHNAFEGCTSLDEIIFLGTTVPYFTGFNTFLSNAVLDVPNTSVTTYQNNLYLRQYNIN